MINMSNSTHPTNFARDALKLQNNGYNGNFSFLAISSIDIWDQQIQFRLHIKFGSDSSNNRK